MPFTDSTWRFQPGNSVYKKILGKIHKLLTSTKQFFFMGTDKHIICEECNEYVLLGKVPFVSHWEGIDTEEWFNYPNYRYQTMKMIAFMREHHGHEIRYITESSKYESLFFDVWSDEDSEEFDIQRSLNGVHGEMKG